MVLIIILAVLQVAAVGALSYQRLSKSVGSINAVARAYDTEYQSRQSLLERVKAAYAQMVDIVSYRQKARELISVKENLRTERGRLAITQAELETVESRLRELEEIERELEASSIDTKEEVKILKKKEADLRQKNENLKAQLSSSMEKMNAIMGEIELNSQMQEQVQAMKTQILSTQDKIDTLLLQIQDGNEQYFILKKRYDALDIEYAQLYEKFSAAEEASKG